METKSLFKPINIGKLTLENRLIMAPMETNMASPDGAVTEQMIAYYSERAAGGLGMITVEFTCVDRSDGLACTPQLSLDNPHLTAGHSRLVDAIHSYGVPVCLQLHHAGRQTTPSILGGKQPIGPSEFDSPIYRVGPVAATEDDIQRLIKAFGRAAGYARTAGYDAIELHGAHGYLLGQFLSPLTNKRDDNWGGDFDRRLNFARAVIKAIRARIGDMPLIYRLSADELYEGGLTIEDTAKIAPHLVAAGIDALHVSTGIAERVDANVEPMHMPDGWRLPYAKRIKQSVNVPVIAVGVIRTPETAAGAINDGSADIIALGRALLADPYWALKAKTGQAENIRPCTSCNWCIDRLVKLHPVGCAENPRVGHELDSPMKKKDRSKEAIVVGAGPGGIVAALMLQGAGYTTNLFEMRDFLGGGLLASGLPPGKDKLLRYRDFLISRLAQSDVKVTMNHAPGATEIIEKNPDLVVLATGARIRPLSIKGSDLPHVAQAYAVTMKEVEIGNGSIVVLGGGETGCEVADMALAKGCKVVLVSRSLPRQLARDSEAIYRRHLVQKLRANPNIEFIFESQVIEITEQGVRVRLNDGAERLVEADQVLSALGRDTGSPLSDVLRAADIKTVTIGDAYKIARIGEAVEAAYNKVRQFANDQGSDLLIF